MMPSTSTTLLRQIGGDVRHARWSEFVARYSPACLKYVQQRFPSLDAEDILQETFAAIAKALPAYRYDPNEKGHFRNYLIGILRNRALMSLRKQKRDEEVLANFTEEAQHGADAPSPPHDDISDAADAEWRDAVFEIALQQLMSDTSIHDRTKQIFVRTMIRQEKPESVAAALGVSRNVVDQQRRRALAKFKTLVAALKGAL